MRFPYVAEMAGDKVGRGKRAASARPAPLPRRPVSLFQSLTALIKIKSSRCNLS